MMRTGVTLLVALLVLPLSGCIDVQERWDDLKEDLEAKPKFQDTVLLSERQPFSPEGLAGTSPPSGQGDVGASWNTTFQVPPGTRSMQVLFSVQFQDPRDDIPDPVPSPTDQRGQIRVFVTPPGNGTAREELYDASGQGGFDIRRPATGEWTVGYDQAIGNGTVTFRVPATVPVTPASPTSS